VYAQLLGAGASGAVWTYLPVKLLTAPLLDGLGRPAWETMIRHVKVGFHQDGGPRQEEDLAAGPEGSIYEAEQGYGGVARFLRLLTAHIDATNCESECAEAASCADWEVTLIGHSMGTIMANHMLAEFGEELDVDKIVYMAAACSVGEYESTVLGYMKRHPATEMYHVTLHPFAEIRDQYAMEIPPSGSLLVWVDNFLSNPSTPRDRTAGRFANLMPALPATPASLRSRIHVKTFGVGAALSSTDPQGHGDFYLFAGPLTEYEKNNGEVSERDPAIRFWRPEFWEPEIENRPTLKQRCGDEPMMERR
ncbi:MAG: alpha/beta hydrolase, partial [Acidobacteria bacterium]|nr:alpha/beta hydrolase [Acidobacteriota bacterium]